MSRVILTGVAALGGMWLVVAVVWFLRRGRVPHLGVVSDQWLTLHPPDRK
jgi:hypothetical protein